MAIALKQTKIASGLTAYQNQFTIAPTAAVDANSLLVLFVSNSAPALNSITSIGDTLTNAWTRGVAALKTVDGNVYTEVWYAPAAAVGTPTITVNMDGYYQWNAILREYTGIATVSPLDVSSFGTDSGYVQTHTAPSTGATTQADELVIAGIATGSINNYSAGAGYSNGIKSGGTEFHALFAEDKIVSTTGGQVATFFTDDYSLGAMVVMTFKAGAAVVLPDPPTTAIGKLWDVYAGWKQYFLKSNGRIQREDGTTVGEGMGYQLQFAIMFNDQAGFDLAETYNRTVMERINAPNGALTNPGGLYLMAGNVTNTTVNNWDWASDGDIDRVQALDMAQAFVDRGIWANTGMAYGARRDLIINDLVTVGSKVYGTDPTKRYMLPESYQLARNPFVLNPSYYDTAAMRQLGTPEMYQMLQGSYDQLARIQNPTNGLFPDWNGANATNDTQSLPFTNIDGFTYSSKFGFDAFRTIFRLVRDYMLNGSKQAYAMIDKFAAFMQTEWNTYGSIDAEYLYNGTRNGGYEKSSMTYGAYLALKVTGRTTTADAIWSAKLKDLYKQDAGGSFYRDNPTTSGQYQGVRDYYTLSWIMFGELLHLDMWQNARNASASSKTVKTTYKGAIPRVRVGGVWQTGEPRVFKNGRWTN